MSGRILRRTLLIAAMLALVSLAGWVWASPDASLSELPRPLEPWREVSLTTYRAIASVAIASAASLLLLAAWTWSTRLDRPFELPDGRVLPIEEAEALVRDAIARHPSVRSASVEVAHARSSIEVAWRAHITPDARIVDVERQANDAAEALARRVGLPLAGCEMRLEFRELVLRRDAEPLELPRAA